MPDDKKVIRRELPRGAGPGTDNSLYLGPTMAEDPHANVNALVRGLMMITGAKPIERVQERVVKDPHDIYLPDERDSARQQAIRALLNEVRRR